MKQIVKVLENTGSSVVVEVYDERTNPTVRNLSQPTTEQVREVDGQHPRHIMEKTYNPEQRSFYETFQKDCWLVIEDRWIIVEDWTGKPPEVVDRKKTMKTRIMTTSEREDMVGRLRNHFIGDELVWAKIADAMMIEGFSEQDFVYASCGGMMHDKSVDECRKMWRDTEYRMRPCNDSVYLWNVINGVYT
ncbi:MAG: hypothetical protein ACYCZQ_03175 [Burkholderiales bacterium]